MSDKPIKNELAYKAALERIEELFKAKKNTPEGNELQTLITLVSAYEDRHYKIDASKSIIKGLQEAVDFAKGEKTGAVVHIAEDNSVRNAPVKKSE